MTAPSSAGINTRIGPGAARVPCEQLTMLTPTQQTPSKSSLTVTLTEPLVILRSADVAGSQSLAEGVTPPSVLRGLLALDLSKASRISSIEVELQAISHVAWTEGMGTSEDRKFFSATQEFFRAASSLSHRRALSVDPGISHYANESEHYRPSPPPLPPQAVDEAEPTPPAPAPAPVHTADDTPQRGRMRVRRRSSADHLVFQRDAVVHLNRPPASSPLSFPPTTEEEVTAHTSTSMHFVESPSTSTSSFPLVETPVPAHPPAHGTLGHSRTTTLGEAQTPSHSSTPHGRNATASPGHDSLPSKGHRSHPSLHLGSIFGRHSRPSSPVHDEGHPESPQSNTRERGREKGCAKGCTKRHCLFTHHARGKTGEAPGREEEHGDGWQEFRKGSYTFPISFEIPSHMPPSVDCDGGSISWKLVAKVRRPGVFTSNLTATRDVHVVSIPADTDVETTGDILIERPWDNQLQYLFKVSGKVFAIGSSISIKMVFMPLDKVRLYKLAIDIEERVDSYISVVNMTRTVTNVVPLLNLQMDDETTPLLPLSSDDPLAYENSPLAALRPLSRSPSEVASQLLGPGPWPIRANLYLPADCRLLHPTTKSRDSSVHVTHSLRFTMRVVRGDDAGMDPKTGKRKLFEVSLRTPVHVLSCYARAEYTALPRYSETLDDGAMLTQNTPTCPCAAERKRRAREGDPSRIVASPVLPTPFGEDPSELLERTLAYERLVSGHASVLGDAPPAYDAGPTQAPQPAVISA